ncbi:MAG: hypothetical protein ACPHUE_05305, partial [Flavobacteriaceae bacterium]
SDQATQKNNSGFCHGYKFGFKSTNYPRVFAPLGRILGSVRQGSISKTIPCDLTLSRSGRWVVACKCLRAVFR